MLDHLLTPEGQDESFRGLAVAAGVTRPTLTHYFGDHLGVLKACMELAGERGRFYTEQVIYGPDSPPEEYFPLTFKAMNEAWPYGLGRLHRLGMIAGLSDPVVGEVYSRAVLEASLKAFEARISRYANQGRLDIDDPRAAAISLFTPLLMTFMAQHQLNGADTRPMDIDAFIDAHVARWLRAHRPRG